MGKTTDLRREIKRTFVPFVRARGFETDQRYLPNILEFRRVVGDELHVFDIQWEKYGRRRFVVNFGKCAATGIEFADRSIPPESVSAAHCVRNGRLQPGKGAALWNWFRQDKPWLKRVFSGQQLYPAEKVIEQLTEMFAELEAYWARDEVGPHMRLHPPLRLRQVPRDKAAV